MRADHTEILGTRQMGADHTEILVTRKMGGDHTEMKTESRPSLPVKFFFRPPSKNWGEIKIRGETNLGLSHLALPLASLWLAVSRLRILQT